MRCSGAMALTSWQENDVSAYDDGSKLTRASIGYRMTGDIEGESTSEVVMFYRPDGTASVLGLWRVTGSVQGRRGSVVFEATGGYDGTAAVSEVRTVPGSGTGDLAGATGAGTTTATRETIDYVLEWDG